MDCRTARLLWDFARPGAPELDAAEAKALANHLTECPDCRALHQADQQLNDRVGRAMRAVPIPVNLHGRILNRLADQRRMLQRRRWLRTGTGVAAALLLTVLGWLYWPVPLVQLDLEAMHYQANNRATTLGQVKDGFPNEPLFIPKLGKPLRFDLPDRLNYRLLTYQGVCELQGQRVPFLEFQKEILKRTHTLRVYILDGKRFDLTDKAGLILSGGVTLRVDVADDGSFGWLYEYTGGSLEPFLSLDTLPAT